MALMPIAASVPIAVAITAEIMAISSVWPRDERITSLVKSFLYQSRVKPVQRARDFDSLNEKTAITIIGA